MITRINSVNTQSHSQMKSNKTAKIAVSNPQQNQTSLMSLSAANSLKALSNISFKGYSDLTPLEKSFIKESEIRIPNIMDLPVGTKIHIANADMPEKLGDLNKFGLNVEVTEDGDAVKYSITSDKKENENKAKQIFIGKFNKNSDKIPTEITYKQGKFGPEATVKIRELGNMRLKMLEGSKVVGKDFVMRMPGAYEHLSGKKNNDISFTGRTVITTCYKEDRTLDAVDKYLEKDFAQEAIKGDYIDTLLANDPTVVIPAGGFGTRFGNISRYTENKPSTKMPTSDSYRVIATALNLAASAGILNNDGTDSIKYLSQKHEIDGANVYNTTKYKEDGGAIAEGIQRNLIPQDKDLIIINADIFTNADVTRAYHALKTLPDAGLVIPYYPVDPERAKSLGLLGIKKDENGNTQIAEFIEKTPYTNVEPKEENFAKIEDYEKAKSEYKKAQTALSPEKDGKFLINPGLYLMSKEAADVLRKQGIELPEETGLGKHVMPKIVDMANKGEFVDENGRQLKVYTVPLQSVGGKPAVWDDIGTAEAYLRLIKDVARETMLFGTGRENRYYGVPKFVLNDFKKNVDLGTGIVYLSQESRDLFDEFKEKYDVKEAIGDIFVVSD